jgi:hypothetical protein
VRMKKHPTPNIQHPTPNAMAGKGSFGFGGRFCCCIIRGALLLLCLALALTAAPARAWDAAGHMLVGQIAWEQMTPAVRARAAELVKPLDARFNNNQPYNFITSGAWMDDMRALGRDYQWSKLHYVTIAWTPTGLPAEIPAAPNVVSGIEDSMRVLRDAKSTTAQQTEALGLIVHFLGDIHQPLHTTDRNNDRGGNAVLISGVPFSDLMQKQGKNLHTFWDKAFRFDGQGPAIVEAWIPPGISRRPSAPGEGIIAEQARKIVARFPREKLPELATATDAAAWAKESHVVGCLKAYPAGAPSGDEMEIRVLTPEFAKASAEIANRRIALAGYRLGDLLNKVLAK